MNLESPSTQKQESKEQIFEAFFENVLQNKGQDIPVIEYNLPYPKEEFLKFLVENKNVLLHGSTNQNLEILEPRQANDKRKKSGNKNAIYGVTDPVLSIFYAIRDRKNLQGVIESGIKTNEETGKSEYEFKIPKNNEETQPWTKGMIYILDKGKFSPEKEDDGRLSNEWIVDVPIKPLAKLEVGPEDFPHMDKVEYN